MKIAAIEHKFTKSITFCYDELISTLHLIVPYNICKGEFHMQNLISFSSLKLYYSCILDRSSESDYDSTFTDRFLLQEIEFFFPSNRKSRLESTVQLKGSTCCIIKPHAVKSGLVGDIITAIQEAGFNITAMTMVCDTNIGLPYIINYYAIHSLNNLVYKILFVKIDIAR